MNLKKIFSLSLFHFLTFLLSPFLPFSLAQSLIDQKLTLEKSIQERTEKIVEKIIGSKEMVVLVNVELSKETSKKTEKLPYPGMGLSEEEYLPGITYTYMPFEGTPGIEIIIKKIGISVTIDKKISDVLVDRIKKEVNLLLGLNPLRGDKVEVQKIAFAEKKISLREQILNLGSHLYWLLGILLLSLFLFGPLRHFFKTIVKAMELRIEADTRIRGYEEMAKGGVGNPVFPGGPIELTLERKRPQLERGEQKEMRKFGFVNSANIKNLIFLLKNEKPEVIAIVANYLSPEFTSQLIRSLSPQLQAQVTLLLTTPKVIDPEEVDKIEKELKTKIDYLVGSEDYFLNLLDNVDKDTQLNILKNLEETNPALAVKLRNQLFFFEDIVLLDKIPLQRVIREVQREGLSLALALKTAPEEIKQKIMSVLTEGARDMLAEQIDLLGEIAPKRIEEEQRLIANVVKALEKSGDIVIDRTKKVIETEEVVVPEEVEKES